MAAGLAVGAGTHLGSGTGFTVAWFAVAGLGLGLAMPAAMNAALGALSPERSGSGSALITAMRQVGATIGVAVLGTVLLSAYRDRLSLTGLPAAAASAVRSSVAGGVAVAHAANSIALLAMVRTAYVHGMDVMLLVCAVIAAVSALLALAFLPRRASTAAPATAGGPVPVGTGPAGSGPASTGPASTGPASTDPAGTGTAGSALADVVLAEAAVPGDSAARAVAAAEETRQNQGHERDRHR